MPVIKPDTSAAVNYGPMDPGTYRAKITEVEVTRSKAGNPMIVPNFDVEVPGEKAPRKRKAFLVIQGEGAYGFGQLLRACHFDELAEKYDDKSIALEDKPDFDTDLLVGQELNVVVEKGLDDKGNMRDNIQNYLRA